MRIAAPHFWRSYVRSGTHLSDPGTGETMVRISMFVLAASLAAAAQEKKPAEAPSLDTNVAPAQKGGPAAQPPATGKKPAAAKPAARKSAGPPGAKPDPALASAFQGSVGTWRCAGTMTLPPDMGGEQVKTRSQMTIRREVGGFAYSGDFRMEGTKVFPSIRGRILWTYDPAAKKFYELSADDSGAAVRGTSDGLQDGRMVWSEEGVMMGKPTKSTTTVVYKGKNQLELQYSMQPADGSAMTGSDQCKRI